MHSMRAETQENYIIPDANISRITWSAPKLNYDLPERIKKILTKKIFHEFSEFKDFGNINRIRQFSADNNIIMYREKISSDVVQVFWNRESNEIIKFLGNNVYAHVQKLLKNEMSIPDKKRTRINAGGIKLSHSENVIDYPTEIDSPSILVESLFAMADAATPETILKREFNSEYVNVFIHYLAECQIISDKKGFNPKLSIPEESRNNNISGRNIMFTKK